MGAPDSVAVVDRILLTGGDAAQALLAKGGLLDGSLTFTLAGFFVYAVVGVTGLYAMFLLALSRVALSVLLGLGPLFIATLLFKSTRRWFESWVSQLTNYASIAILTGLVSALLLRLVTTAAASAAAAGPAVQVADAVRVCLASGLILLVLRQVMPMAAGLSHGFALHSFGAVSRTLGWGLEQGADMLSRGRRAATRASVR